MQNSYDHTDILQYTFLSPDYFPSSNTTWQAHFTAQKKRKQLIKGYHVQCTRLEDISETLYSVSSWQLGEVQPFGADLFIKTHREEV